MSDWHAVVLAGGKGTRLRPYTTTLPKPLVPIGDEFPILEIVLRQLALHGFISATIAIGHQGHLIKAFVGDGKQWGLQIDYAEEALPLGTIGPVLQILHRLPKYFLVMNGDILTDLNYGALMETHTESKAPITVATYRRDVHVDFGVLEVEGDRIIGFREKPTLSYMVSMGVYAMSRTTLETYPLGPFGFDTLMRDLVSRGADPRTYPFTGYWVDIGRPEDYDRANMEFDELRGSLLPGS